MGVPFHLPLATQMPAKAQVSDSHETSYVWKIDLIWEGSSHIEEKDLCSRWPCLGSGGQWVAVTGLGIIVFPSISPLCLLVFVLYTWVLLRWVHIC